MSSVLCHNFPQPVQEEIFVEEDVRTTDAVPFDTTEKSIIAIVNGKVANADEVLECDILIKDGLIRTIGKDLDIPDEAQIIDAREKFVIPGAIDYDMRLTDTTGMSAETIAEHSKAIVQGGTTTIANLLQCNDMEKSTDFLNNLRNNENQLFCNIGIKMCANEEDDITDKKVQLGVATFQLAPEQVFSTDDEQLLQLLKKAKSCGAVVNIDVRQGALDNSILNGNSILTPAEDLEESIIRKISSLALLVDVPVCFLNVGSDGCVGVLAEYHAKGLRVYGEVLTANLDSLKNMPWTKSCLILSSHQTKLHTEEMVENENSDHPEDWLSVIYHHMVDQQVFDICKFVEVTSTNPAKLLNMYPSRGCIKEGSRADIAVLHPMKRQPVSGKSATRFRLANDSELVGMVDHVTVDGKLIVSDGQLRPLAAWGQLLVQPPVSVTEKVCRQEVRTPLQRIDRPQDNVDSPKEGRRAWDKRKCISQGEIFDKELGIYQRPLSAHGVRNQQDSTFTVKTFF